MWLSWHLMSSWRWHLRNSGNAISSFEIRYTRHLKPHNCILTQYQKPLPLHLPPSCGLPADHGAEGLPLQRTLHGLIGRVLPATVVQQLHRRPSKASSSQPSASPLATPHGSMPTAPPHCGAHHWPQGVGGGARRGYRTPSTTPTSST